MSQECGQRSPTALRIHRMAEGESFDFRMLSKPLAGRIPGILTHFVKDRSQACPGEDRCIPSVHRSGTFWKGYVAAQRYDAKLGLWFPVALEVTEAAELDMRDNYERGQVWHLSKLPDKKGVSQAVVARFVAVSLPMPLPEPYDIMPAIRTLYHVDVIRLCESNPLPGRVMVEPVAGPGPGAKQESPKATDQEVREVLNRLRNGPGRRGGDIEQTLPVPTSNGKGGAR
jgi:hypothetical protein